MWSKSVVRTAGAVLTTVAIVPAWLPGDAEAGGTLSTGVVISAKISSGPWHGRLSGNLRAG